jgi:hypothetical protein
MRLNGWQRLWIVFSILYLILLAADTITEWPRIAPEAEQKLPKRADQTQPPPSYPSQPPPDFQAGGVLVSAPVRFPNGAVLQVRVAKTGDTTPDQRVRTAYWTVV